MKAKFFVVAFHLHYSFCHGPNHQILETNFDVRCNFLVLISSSTVFHVEDKTSNVQKYRQLQYRQLYDTQQQVSLCSGNLTDF